MSKLILYTILLIVQITPIAAQRIISLAPSITYTLEQLGANDNVIGVTSYCPQINNKAIIVGDVLSINIEKIISLKPDVVFTMAFTSQQTIEKLKKLGIKIINFQTPRTFNEICQQTMQIAQLSNTEDFAKKLIETEKNIIDSIANTTKSINKKIVVQIGTHPIFTAPPNTYIGEIITKCNCTNIISNNNSQTSREFIISSKPDIIIISSMNGNYQEEERTWHKLTEANIFIIDDKACCPTPLFYRQTLQQIASFCKISNEK